MEKCANGRRVDLLLILDGGAEELGIGGVIPELFFKSLPKLKGDGSEHRFSASIKIVAVQAAYRETIYFSIPNPRSCKGLYPLGEFPVFGCSPVI